MTIFGDNKYEKQYNRSKDDFHREKWDVKGILDRITEASNSAYADSEMGVEDRFGDSMNRVRDSVADDRSGAQRTIGRALMAGGGDISGEGATALNKVTESGNSAISDAIRGYTDANRQERRFDLSRGDNLMSRELAGNQDLLNMTLGQMMNAQNLDIQKKTANKQLFADVLGSVLSAAGGGDKNK